MGHFQVWITEAHLRALENQEEYKCHVAVWVNSTSDLPEFLSAFFKPRGYQLIWYENSHTVIQYIEKYGQQHKIGRIARNVHAMNRIAAGELTLANAPDKKEHSEEESFWFHVETSTYTHQSVAFNFKD